MKAIVLSDSHGDFTNVNKVLRSYSEIELVFFCGDSEGTIEKAIINYPNKMFVAVRGNCDFASEFPIDEFMTIEGKKIMITHGHRYNVKYTQDEVIAEARNNNCDMVIYGHTHSAFTDYEDGLYIMNPGSSFGYKATYGIIDITSNGIVTSIKNID